MPRVILQFDPTFGDYSVIVPTNKAAEQNIDPEYELVVDMKASTFKSYTRTAERWNSTQKYLEKLFIEAQMAGRAIREQ